MMQEVNLSNTNQVYLNNKNNADEVTTSPIQQSQQVENGDNKIKLALAALAVVGTAIAAGVAIYKHQSPSKVADGSREQVTKLLKDINFNKGVASLKDGSKFTGIVQDTLKNGDKVTLEYADGILKKSIRNGSNTFEKLYETLENGTHKVTTTKNGKTSSVVIENLQNAAKDSQSKLKTLLNTKDSLTIEEFQKQADEIKFKSKKQQDEIQNIIKDKQKVLDEQKAAAEKAAKEAQEKARLEAEQKAKLEAERLAREAKEKAELDFENFKKKITTLADNELNETANECLREQNAIYQKVKARNPEIKSERLNNSERREYCTPDELKQIDLLENKRNIICRELSARKKVQDFNTAKGLITGETSALITSKESGGSLTATIGIKQGNHGQYRREVMLDDQVIGVSENIVLPDKGCYIPSLDAAYETGKSALEIKFLGTSEKYKGLGKALVKAAVEDSKAAGFEGRVWVDACGGSLPMDVGCYCGKKYGSSPVPFYYKSGFRMINPQDNVAIEEGLRVLEQTGVYPKTAPQGGNMFLPEESIKAILNS